jgi:hypothetical protein
MKKGMTIGEFVRKATPIVAEKYGLRLDNAEKLIRKMIQDEYANERRGQEEVESPVVGKERIVN